MHIKSAIQKDSDPIVQLLNEVTQKLMSQNIKQWDYPWDNSLISSDISSGFQYIVEENNKIIAVFSIKDMPANYWTKEEKPDQMYLYRIAVAPQCQGKSVGNVICNWIHDYAIQNNKTIYLDCWAGNEKLKNFYDNAGFSYIGDYPEESYLVSVFKTQEKMKSQGSISMDENKQVVRNYFKAWIDNNSAILTSIFDRNIVYSECYGPEYHGIEQIIHWFSDWNTRGKVLEWKIKQFIQQDNVSVVEWFFKCEYDNNIDGFDGVSLITFNDENKIISVKEFQSKAQHYYPYE
jgi:ribosomal protein S18 acetylase RimI-like enzyme